MVPYFEGMSEKGGEKKSAEGGRGHPGKRVKNAGKTVPAGKQLTRKIHG